jgi:hypothetical protein
MSDSTYPSGLTPNQLAEAEALIANDFAYIGKLDDYFDQEELDKYHCFSWKSWKFNSSPGNCFLDAVCHGEYYSWYLEDHPDLMKPNFLNDRVLEIKAALKAVVYPDKSNKVREPSPYQQLSLF